MKIVSDTRNIKVHGVMKNKPETRLKLRPREITINLIELDCEMSSTEKRLLVTIRYMCISVTRKLSKCVPEQIKSPTMTFSSDVVEGTASGALYPKPRIGNFQSAVIFPWSLSSFLDFEEAKH